MAKTGFLVKSFFVEFTTSQGERDVHECSGMFSMGDVLVQLESAERAGL